MPPFEYTRVDVFEHEKKSAQLAKSFTRCVQIRRLAKRHRDAG